MRKIVIVSAIIVLIVASVATLSGTWFSPATGRPAATAPIEGVRTFTTTMSENAGMMRNGITVTGEGVIAVKPDIARVTLGVEVSNTSASVAQQEAATKMDSVMTELKKLGIQEKDIQTVRFDLSPEYDYTSQTPVLKGYRVTNLVTVVVRDVSKVGGLLDSVVASGATRLHGINFTVSDPNAAGTQGREQAMKSARSKAEQLAKLAGVTLGPAVAIEESVSAPEIPMEMEKRDAVAAAPATPISPGMQEVHTVVRVTYSIK